MSKVCEVCGKHPVAGRSISHSHRVSNRMFRPNIQKVTIRDAKGHVRQRVHLLHEGREGRARVTVSPCETLKLKSPRCGLFCVSRQNAGFVEYGRRSTAGNRAAIFLALYSLHEHM